LGFSGRKVFLPFPWEEMGFFPEERVSSGRNGRNWEETPKGYSSLILNAN